MILSCYGEFFEKIREISKNSGKYMGKSRKILRIWEKYYGKFGKIFLKVRITFSIFQLWMPVGGYFYTGYYWGGRSRQAGKDRGQGERSTLLIRCCSRPPSDGARNSQPGSLTGQLLSISFLGLNRATYNGSNDAFSSACYQQCSLLFDFDEEAYCMTNIIAFKLLHYWYILRLPQGKA